MNDASPDVPILIPARRGLAVRVARGQRLRVVNTFGSQVIDTWAFSADDMQEFMSMEHSRAAFRKLSPSTGDAFVTTQRRPILRLVEDSSPGVHDTLIAACDVHRYRLLGHVGHHDNCTENLRQALAELGLVSAVVPCPLNLFMNIPVSEGVHLQWLAPVSRPGDHVDLLAELDCVVVFSACPMDIIPINGEGCLPRDAHCHLMTH